MIGRTDARRSSTPSRGITLALTAAVTLATFAGCAAPFQTAESADAQATTAPADQDAVNAACLTMLENYTASLKSSSTGQDHPGNYTVKAAATADLAAQLPPGTLDNIEVDCVVSAYSSTVESIQLTGVILDPSVDAVASVRDALTAAEWKPDSIETGVAFRGPEPEMAGALTYVLDAPTAERVGVPTGAFAVIAGKWDLWGAF